MARRVDDPMRLMDLREEAVRLYEAGASSYRAVADAIGRSEKTVRRWIKSLNANGQLPPIKFDRHGTGGAKWDRKLASEKRDLQARRRRRLKGVDAANALAGGVANEPPARAMPPKVVTRRRRERRVGDAVKRYLSPDLAVWNGRDAAMASPPWLTPLLTDRIARIVGASGPNGVTTDGILARLPTAFSVVDAEFRAEFESALRSRGYASTAAKRWLPPSR